VGARAHNTRRTTITEQANAPPSQSLPDQEVDLTRADYTDKEQQARWRDDRIHAEALPSLARAIASGCVCVGRNLLASFLRN
jgi:hypothetical protein